MIKAVIIGFSHMHVNEIALYISEQPNFNLVGIADVNGTVEQIPALRYTPKWNLENVRRSYCDKVYDDYKIMLDELKPDIAFVLSENAQKTEIAEEVAKRGIDICIEKPVAVSLAEAKKIKECVNRYNVLAIVNWPVAWRDYLYKMKSAIDSKIVGEPIKLRYINGHTGPLGKGARHRGVKDIAEEMTDEQRGKTWWHSLAHGGGVFLDICCYGCFFSKWFLGDGEKSVISYGANLNTDFGDTDDNFAAVIEYEKKMSVVEGTWTTPRVAIPSGPMMICTDGVIMCTGKAEGAPDVAAYDMFGNAIEVPNIKLDEKFKNIAWQYANYKKTGEEIFPMLSLDKNIEIMAMLDAIICASKSGRTQKI